MRGFTSRVLRRFGFRRVLVWVTLIASLFMASYSLFRMTTPVALILVLLALGGVFRTLVFGSLHALALADVEEGHMSQATSFSFMAQRISQTAGVAVAAFILHVGSQGSVIPIGAFSAAFLVIATFSSASALVFYRLDSNAGSSLSGQVLTGRGRNL